MGGVRCSPRQLDQAHRERWRVSSDILDLDAAAGRRMDVFTIPQIDAGMVDAAASAPKDEVATLGFIQRNALSHARLRSSRTGQFHAKSVAVHIAGEA